MRSEVETIPDIQPRTTEILAILDEVQGLAVTRHDFVHGAAIERHVGKISVTATMARLLQPQGKARRPPRIVTTKEIEATAAAVYDWATACMSSLSPSMRAPP